MGSYLNENGFICYERSGISLSDTHGGRSQLHLREMEDVVNAIVDKKLATAMEDMYTIICKEIDKYAADVWQNLITSLKGALNTDVVSEVTIAFDNAREIFYGKKAQEYVAKNIYRTIDKELNRIKGINVRL